MAEKKRRKKTGYLHKSNALCMTVYDLRGAPLPQAVVDELLATVNEKALSKGLITTYTRT
jgi:hypothetical protein